jgi:hypothetical protein
MDVFELLLNCKVGEALAHCFEVFDFVYNRIDLAINFDGIVVKRFVDSAQAILNAIAN